MTKRVVVAMSGGVDSAVAAYLMKEEGYEVLGITLRLAPDPSPDAKKTTGRCCSIDDMVDARLVCEKVGIPFYAIDAREKFKKAVFDPFVQAYRQGITPIPCVACNHVVKFGDLLATSRNLNASLATGHYAKLTRYGSDFAIARPRDMERDQTYYLYGISRHDLDGLHFPLGDLLKPEVRTIAKTIGLNVYDKKDSQEICFVPDNDHSKVVEKALGKEFSGSIVGEDGRVLGTHRGVHRFTIGQRRGLGVAEGERLFVADLDPESQKVVLAKHTSLGCHQVRVANGNWLHPLESWPKTVHVKIRARSAPVPCTLTPMNPEQSVVDFRADDALFGVALGQAAVFYDGDIMLGGGTIAARLDGAFPRAMPNQLDLV